MMDSVFTQCFSMESEATAAPPDSVQMSSVADRVEKKRLKRKINALEVKVEKIISGKKESDSKVKELTSDLAKERKAVRAIEGRLITASLKVKSLKEELKKSKSEAAGAEKKFEESKEGNLRE